MGQSRQVARSVLYRSVGLPPRVRCLSTSVQAGQCADGRPAVVLRSDRAEVKVMVGGGHLSSIRSTDLPAGVDDINPLWNPPWQTVDPSLRRLVGPQIGDGLEGQLLSCIAGHNLCADVFGGHSAGEVERAGLCFHGEAGLVQWEVLTPDNLYCLALAVSLSVCLSVCVYV